MTSQAVSKSSYTQVASGHEASVKVFAEELKAWTEATQVLQSETDGADGHTYSLFQENPNAALHTPTDLKGFDMMTAVRQLAEQEHSTALAQLASRISAIMKFGADADNDPFVKVKDLITDLIRLQAEASPETNQKSHCDEEKLLSVVYKNAIDSRRAVWRVITSIEQKEKSKSEEQLASHAREYIAKVEGELQKIREGVLALMDKKLVSSPGTDESKAFYYKMKSDYHRYLAEFTTGETKRKILEMPVTRKTQQVANTHVQHDVNTVEVERSKLVKETVQEKINHLTKHAKVPRVCAVKKTAEIAQVQFLDKVDEIPVVAQRQISMETVQKTMEIPQLQCVDKVVDNPEAPQVHVSEETVEIAQLQAAEKIVETRETQTIQRIQTSESLVHLTGAMKPNEPDAKIKLLAEEELHEVGGFVLDTNGDGVVNDLGGRSCVTGEMRKNKLPSRLDLDSIISDDTAWQCKHYTERGVRKLHESGTTLAEDMEALLLKTPDSIEAHYQASLKTARNPNGEPYPAFTSDKSWDEASGKTVTHRQVPLIQRVQKTVEVPRVQFIDRLVDDPDCTKKRRKAEGQDQDDDVERFSDLVLPSSQSCLCVSIASSDKGYGFGKAPSGEVVFIHASAVHGAEVLVVGTEAWTQVVSDHARVEGGYRARKAWGQRAWKEEKDRERASRAAQQVRRAAALTAELAAQSESKVFEVCSHPPGLSEEALVTASPHLVNDSPPCSPPPLGVRETPASTLPVNNKPLQEARVSHLAGSSRAPRPRSITRAQDNTAVLEETLKLFVEATGKDDASMRQQLVSKRSAELLRSREFWRTRVEEKQRFQAKKKEAWEFFRRMPSFKPKSQEEFEEEFRRRVMTGYFSGSTEGREKYLDEWKTELQKKALEGDSRLEARERVKMGEEDSSSRRRTEWERILDRSPFLKTAS